MVSQNKLEKYYKIIWNNQLPKEEEDFLFDLLNNKKSSNFKIDFESDYSLFLAYNASKNNYEGYDESQINSFKTLQNRNKLAKLSKITPMGKVFKMLNQNGIIPILLKGAAFLSYYAVDMPRMMDDIDISVSPEEFDKTVSLIIENGYEFVEDTGFHVAVTSKNLDIDIHRYIFKNGGDKENRSIYKDLIKTTFLGAEVYVLSPTNMFLHQLANRGEDICFFQHTKRHFKWIVDCYYLLTNNEIKAEDVFKKSIEIDNSYFVFLTLSKLATLFPSLLNIDGFNLNDKKYLKVLKLVSKKVLSNEKQGEAKRKGIKYLYKSVFWDRWCDAKLFKLTYKEKGSVLKIFLTKQGIESNKDLIKRFKKALKNSKAD